MWVSKLGYFNSFLLTMLILRAFAKTLTPVLRKQPKVLKLYQKIVKHHKYFAYALLVTGAVHGYLLLGKVYFHSGWVLYGLIVITGAIGYWMKRLKKPKWLKLHMLMAFGTAFLLVNHYALKLF